MVLGGKTVTNNEKELVAALEADIEKWEFVAGCFERDEVQFDDKTMSGRDYARDLRQRIAEWHALVEKVKKD